MVASWTVVVALVEDSMLVVQSRRSMAVLGLQMTGQWRPRRKAHLLNLLEAEEPASLSVLLFCSP